MITTFKLQLVVLQTLLFYYSLNRFPAEMWRNLAGMLWWTCNFFLWWKMTTLWMWQYWPCIYLVWYNQIWQTPSVYSFFFYLFFLIELGQNLLMQHSVSVLESSKNSCVVGAHRLWRVLFWSLVSGPIFHIISGLYPTPKTVRPMEVLLGLNNTHTTPKTRGRLLFFKVTFVIWLFRFSGMSWIN